MSSTIFADDIIYLLEECSTPDKAWELMKINNYNIMKDLNEIEVADTIVYLMDWVFIKKDDETLKSILFSDYRNIAVEYFLNFDGMKYTRDLFKGFLDGNWVENVEVLYNDWGLTFNDLILTLIAGSDKPLRDWSILKKVFNENLCNSAVSGVSVGWDEQLRNIKIVGGVDLSHWGDNLIMSVFNVITYVYLYNKQYSGEKVLYNAVGFVNTGLSKIDELFVEVNVPELFETWFENVEFNNLYNHELFDSYLNLVGEGLPCIMSVYLMGC